MKSCLITLLTAILAAAPAFAQSLKPEVPSPMQPGINKGTVDNFVGTHYWYFYSQPGKTHVHAQFTPMGLMANSYRSTITVTLSDEAHTWHTDKVLSSDSKTVDCTFDGEVKTPTKILIAVAPPSGGLVRVGGDYQLEATGAVNYGEKSTADPIVGTYNEMAGYTSLLGATKFLADGTIQTASGAVGKWKLFHKDTQTYVIDIDGQDRQSLQYVPGRGLVGGGTIFFQQLK